MDSRTLREQLFLPLLFWAEVLCELEEHGKAGQTRAGGVPPLCAVDTKGLQSGYQLGILAVIWSKARSLPQVPPQQDEDLSQVPNIHSFLPRLQILILD